jgi:acyl-coenzyme A synthetase/AMP-(fatty) acid ligase
VVVGKGGADLAAGDVRQWVGEALAPFKVPTHVLFRESLPYTASGKVVKDDVELDLACSLGDTSSWS